MTIGGNPPCLSRYHSTRPDRSTSASTNSATGKTSGIRT